MGPRVLGALLLLVFAWPFAVVWLQHSALSPDARDAVYPPRKHAPMPAIRRVDISLTSGTGEAASAGALEDVRGVAAAAVARAGRDASASPANGAPADGRQRVKAFIGVQVRTTRSSLQPPPLAPPRPSYVPGLMVALCWAADRVPGQSDAGHPGQVQLRAAPAVAPADVVPAGRGRDEQVGGWLALHQTRETACLPLLRTHAHPTHPPARAGCCF